MMPSVEPESGMLAAALAYARKDIPVFPCRGDKRPYTVHGFKDASVDEQQIRSWWTQWPDALIGMPTGRASGYIALDIDVRAGYDGADALHQLQTTHGKLPDTAESLTPGGGRHLIYRWPGFEVKNSASKLGLGIDVRGDGGYIILPPSRLPDGRAYEWEGSNPKQAADLPVWALRLLGQSVPPPSSVKEEKRQEGATEGQRNVYLTSIAGRLAYAGLGREQIRAMLTAENARACSPPLSADELEATMLKSAGKWVLPGERAPESPEGARGIPWLPADQWVAGMTPPAWIIRDYLERATLNVTVGGWGSGKSVIELDRALRVCHGMPWQGISVDAGIWVYVVGEAQRGFQRRIAAWHQHHGLDVTPRLVVIPEAVLLGVPDHEAALRVVLEEVQAHYGEAISCVTLDTLARCFGLQDESSNSDVGRWVGSLYAYIIDPFGCAASVLHHHGHRDTSRGRGASALPGATDQQWALERVANLVVLRCTKSKDSEHPPARAWMLSGETLEIGGESVICPVVSESEAPPEAREHFKAGSWEEKALAALRELHDRVRANLEREGRGGAVRVDRQAWRDECLKVGMWKDYSSAAGVRTAMSRVVGNLRSAGLIVEDGDWITPVPEMSDGVSDETF